VQDGGVRLQTEITGTGKRTAVLLHGMMGSSESWWRVAPLLAACGYRVLALDLPGHGLSPRDPELTVERAAAAAVDTVRAAAPSGVAVAIGHSFGGLVLSAAAPRLSPGLAVYVDAPFASRGGWDRDEVRGEYEADRAARTVDGLRTTRSYYSDRDCIVEGRAAERFDPDTAAAVAAAAGGSWPPAPGSIVVRADPSAYVPADAAADLEARGVSVRSVPGAAHALWYSHFDAFVAALPEVFGDPDDNH
jgi:pimeloyl-ACP methyl ester carboxylesterase